MSTDKLTMELPTLGLVAMTASVLLLGLSGCTAPELRESLQSEDREDYDEQLRQLPVFRALDTDGDGHISTEEIEAASESLASLDDNGDGRLLGNEFRPRRPRLVLGAPADLPGGTRIITRRRVTGDNPIEIADLPPEVRSLLSSADTDGDGRTSAAELLAMTAAQNGEPGGDLVGTSLVATLDKDQDGTVSHTEIESAAQSLRELDSDGDGRISPNEFQLHLKQQ